MTPSFENLQKLLKQLPGLGYRSAERIALHLLVEKPNDLEPLMEALSVAKEGVRSCDSCGNITEEETCIICKDPQRNEGALCIVESIPELHAIERSGSFRGTYHVLHGKLSPIKGVNPEDLNLQSLRERFQSGTVSEVIFALDNDIEGEATCHYIQETMVGELPITVSRIGFGLPSGGGVGYADAATLKSALEGRKSFL